MKKLFLAYEVLSPRSRKRFFLVLGVSTIRMAFEVMGIGLVMPLIDLLVRPESAEELPLWKALLSYLGGGTNILLLGLACLVGLFATKNLFLACPTIERPQYPEVRMFPTSIAIE